MKRFFAFLFSALLAGSYLTACGSPVTPASTLTPEPTLANPTAAASPTILVEPTAVASPTIMVEPTTTPTATPLPGTQVSFDRLSLVIPIGLAAGGSGMLVPEAKGETVAPWDVAPEHIQLTLDGYALQDKFHQPRIYIYPAETYAQMQERGSAAQSLAQLRAVLAQDSMVNVKELPFVPFFNVPQALAAQVKVIPFQNGRGVRMLTEYAMGRAIINNHELIYHFQGLTADEQYYVIIILPVTAPGLPADGTIGGPVPDGGVSVPDFNDMNANWMGYYGDVRQMLQDLAPGAYTPDLDLLDALIGSLTISG